MNVPARVPILTYHSLDETGGVISTPPAVFRAQMQDLLARGFTGLRLSDLLEAWEGRKALPDRPVVVTFDDGFQSFADHAAPALEAVGFSATVFAVAGRAGGDNGWDTQPAGVPRLPLLGNEALRDLARRGFEIGSHGMTHAPLRGASASTLAVEVGDSRRALEDTLGRAVTTFAYPYGDADEAARRAVAEHYRAACSVEMGTATRGGPRHWLSRIEMYYFRELPRFRLLGTAPGEAYVRVRAIGRRVRKYLG